MSNISSVVKAMREPQRPGTLKSLMAGLAIAWGTRTFSTQAMDATERRDAANAEAEALRLEIESAHELLSERLTDAIRAGYCDPHVKARAAVLGWAETTPSFVATEDNVLTPDTDEYYREHLKTNQPDTDEAYRERLKTNPYED